MIKRPFIWGIGAFVIGILLAWYKFSLVLIITLALVGFLVIYHLISHGKKYVNHKDSFLWSLPILFILGFLAMGDRMKPPDIDRMFDDKTPCVLTGEITMEVKKSWGKAYYLKDNLVTLPNQTSYLVEEVLLNTEDSKRYLVGNKITASGTIQKFSINTNPGGFNEHLYYKIQNIDYKVNAEIITVINASYSKFHYILNNIKEELIQVYERVFPEKEAGTLMAMVLGEKYLLGDEINRLYQENGISHILAISGLHVSMVGAAIYFILKKLRLGLVTSTILSIAFVYSYGILTNFSVSTNRAVVMYIVMLFANILGKTFDMLSALSLSAFLILIQNPMEIFSVGFILSFGAVLGIALLLPRLNDLLPTKLSSVKSIYVSISAQVFTMPFVLYYFFQFPVYSVIINLLIIPFTSLLLITSLLAGILGAIYIPLGVFMAGSANYILKLYELICELGSALPGNLITIGRPSALQIIIYFILIFAFVYGVKRYGKKRLIGILAIAIVILIIPDTHKGLTVTMLDVGQGEAIFMETEKGSTILLDGGSSNVKQVGKYRIKPYLLCNGIDKLDYAIVTHTDTDHVSGLMEIIEGDEIIIKCLVLPDTRERNEIYLKLEDLVRNKGIDLKYVRSGDEFIEGRLCITVLHPAKDYIPASNNDYSTVLSISYGEFDMLLTGDIEEKGERELIKWLTGQVDVDINRYGILSNVNYADDALPLIKTDYDVLKVAHHGSRNSTGEEILAIIKPELSLISCSKNNRYGHPHTELIERLQQSGSSIMITTEAGAITIKTDGERMVVE
ncbi:MAG: DNA internalization-related competence protein ComEC/Rec2, partial [Clostridiales bacterium]|nr:DNA internalization-related competence protein ComEC/Rec2 [Clostridiales bacterium]